jgi:hypothetical protein
MAFDIYGNHLRRGHCEVHPDQPEEYPCSICMERSRGEPTYPEPVYPEAEYPEPPAAKEGE